jgi:hypothetical protein
VTVVAGGGAVLATSAALSNLVENSCVASHASSAHLWKSD